MRLLSATFFSLLLLLLLVLHTTTSAPATSPDDEDAELVHLFPEQPRLAQRLPSGASQRFRVHALAPTKVYDLKVSYPASEPAAFVLEVERVVAPAETQTDGATTNTNANKAMPVRRLNTAKLRLLPHELLRSNQALVGEQPGGDDQLGGDEQQREQRVNVNAYRLALQQQQQQQLEHDAAGQGETVTVDIVLRADAEGVSAVVDPRTRECVFDIVVEEMLLGGAFPFDTLVLLAWLALVLAAALKWAYPYLLRKVALELPEEREVYVGSSSSSSSSNSSRKES